VLDHSWLSNAETALISTDRGYFNLSAAIAGKSAETQRKYIDWLKSFYLEVMGVRLNDMTAIPIEPFLGGVTPASVEAWLGAYAASGHSKSGLGQARAAIVFMARMLVLAKQAPSSLWHDLRLVRLPDHAATAAYGESAGGHAARWLTPEEVHILMDTVKTQPNKVRAKRDFALIWLMVTLGLRRDELAALLWENLTRRGANWVLRIRGKRNKWRAVGVPRETILALQPWAELLVSEGTTSGLPTGLMIRRVWRSEKVAVEGITGNAVWRIVTDAWRATGLTGDLAPHDLRRTAAAIALEAGAKEREIQQMLGHSSIETTHRYLAPMRENTATYRIAQMLSDTGGGGLFDV
jgi:integrase